MAIAPVPGTVSPTASSGARARLLLVDDEARVLRSLERLFADLYTVEATTEPLQALTWIDARPFDVVISDQRMPVMSGVQFLREVRRRAPEMVRLLLTGYADLPAVIASINEGEIWRYLTKPWVPQALLDSVAQAVEKAAQLAWLRGATPALDPMTIATPVLVYDEDPDIAAALQRIAGPAWALRALSSFEAARQALAELPVPLLVAEVQMGGVETLPLLRALKLAQPDLILLVLARQQDAGLLIRLVNECQIFRFLSKPINPQRLIEALGDAAALRRRVLTARGHDRGAAGSGEVGAAEPLGQRIADYFRRRRA